MGGGWRLPGNSSAVAAVAVAAAPPQRENRDFLGKSSTCDDIRGNYRLKRQKKRIFENSDQDLRIARIDPDCGGVIIKNCAEPWDLRRNLLLQKEFKKTENRQTILDFAAILYKIPLTSIAFWAGCWYYLSLSIYIDRY